MNNLYRKHFLLKGRVQGVGFRTTTEQKARDIGVTGFVKNKLNGSVEVIAEGTKKELIQLHNFLKQGPSRAKVNKIKTSKKEKIEKRNFLKFKIEY